MYNVYIELPRLSLTEFLEMQEAVDREVVRHSLHYGGGVGDCFFGNQHVSHGVLKLWALAPREASDQVWGAQAIEAD